MYIIACFPPVMCATYIAWVKQLRGNAQILSFIRSSYKFPIFGIATKGDIMFTNGAHRIAFAFSVCAHGCGRSLGCETIIVLETGTVYTA